MADSSSGNALRFSSALFSQQVNTNRPFQFQKCSWQFMSTHRGQYLALTRSLLHRAKG